jgi:hypothetical protein
MHAAMRSKLVAMPLMKLRKLHSELGVIIRYLKNRPLREVDVAYDHRGLPGQTCQVLDVRQITPGSKWRQLEKVYCCEQRCKRCPHGPYWYEYRANARRKTVAVTFKGAPAFDYELLQELKRTARPGKPYVIKSTEGD